MDNAYTDKLDGKIPEDFWERKTSDWRMEEQQVKMAIEGLNGAETSDRALNAQRILELANKAYSLYISQDSTEKARLLRMLFSNCSVGALSVTPAYGKPFDMIFERAKLQKWSGRLGSNARTGEPVEKMLSYGLFHQVITEDGSDDCDHHVCCQPFCRTEGNYPRTAQFH
jgi:hypothetical protein